MSEERNTPIIDDRQYQQWLILHEEQQMRKIAHEVAQQYIGAALCFAVHDEVWKAIPEALTDKRLAQLITKQLNTKPPKWRAEMDQLRSQITQLHDELAALKRPWWKRWFS